jgi:hypothetical protein
MRCCVTRASVSNYFHQMLALWRGLDNPAKFNRSFVDVCINFYNHMRMIRNALNNASVTFEGMLTSLDFWIACVGSQNAQEFVFQIRSNKQFIKEFINAVSAGNVSSAIASVSRLFGQLQSQPLAMKKDIWQNASLALVLEQSLRAGDLVGAISCCCSMMSATSANGENVDKLLNKVLSSMNFDDGDSTSHITAIISTLYEVASFVNSRVAASAAVSIEYAREICEQAAEICDRILKRLLQEVPGASDIDAQIEMCSSKLREASRDVSVSVISMPAIAEKWAASNRSKIFDAIFAPLPQLKRYSWTCEAFTQASIGLKLIALLCSSEKSEILSVLWVFTQFFAAVSSAQLVSSCPQLYQIFMRCSSGGRKFNFISAGVNAITVPGVLSGLTSAFKTLCQAMASESSHVDRAKGISDFSNSIVADPTVLSIASSFLYLRSVRKSLAGALGSVSKFFQTIGHASTVRLSLLLEHKKFLDATYLLKHLQQSCLNLKGNDVADVALIVDFCVVGLISQASKTVPSLFCPLGATLLYTACSCSSINRSVPGAEFSKILYAAVAPAHVSENEMELAVSTFALIFECFGKSFTVDVELHSAAVTMFLAKTQFLVLHASVAQDIAPRVQQLASLIGPVLRANPKLLGPSFGTVFCMCHIILTFFRFYFDA